MAFFLDYAHLLMRKDLIDTPPNCYYFRSLSPLINQVLTEKTHWNFPPCNRHHQTFQHGPHLNRLVLGRNYYQELYLKHLTFSLNISVRTFIHVLIEKICSVSLKQFLDYFTYTPFIYLCVRFL